MENLFNLFGIDNCEVIKPVDTIYILTIMYSCNPNGTITKTFANEQDALQSAKEMKELNSIRAIKEENFEHSSNSFILYDCNIQDDQNNWIKISVVKTIVIGSDKIPSVGQQIKKARESKGWTRYKLSLESGVQQKHLQQIEDEETSPSVKIMECLARTLQIQIKIG